MNHKPFVIENRFYINPALNHFRDTITGEDLLIEPRIMAVLCYLSQRSGELVTRKQIVEDIWNNYGGGDEALSQVVSFLRKILDDRDKKLIRTIPKKGYLLSAVITNAIVNKPEPKRFISSNQVKTLSRAMTVLYVLLTAFYLIYSGISRDKINIIKHEYLVVNLPKTPVVISPKFRLKKLTANPATPKPFRDIAVYPQSSQPKAHRAANNDTVYTDNQTDENDIDSSEVSQARPQPNPHPIVIVNYIPQTKVRNKVKLNIQSTLWPITISD